MLTDTVTRRLEALGDISRQGKRVNGLFRLMECPLLWYEAYAAIHANRGATTAGVDGTTMDGFSDERVRAIIARLRAGTYRFQPARRVYIPKAKGRTRPLGIASGDDKLVQDVVRGLLARIYEPVFRDSSHGFRRGRSCHTALDTIEHQWTGVKWLVNVDLQSFFDTIDHEVMIALLEKKIADHRFIDLVRGMLRAGYLEEWTFHGTYSGTPQGNGCSPILTNVYLHELDLFMDHMSEEFRQGKRRKDHPVYRRYTKRIATLRQRWDSLPDDADARRGALRRDIRCLEGQRRTVPSGDPFDAAYKRLFYCRYADDFAIGIIGSKAEAEQVRETVTHFVQTDLKLTVSADKSGIRHAREGMPFLGYRVCTYTGRRVIKTRRGTRHTTARTMTDRVQLHIPPERLQGFCHAKRYGTYETTTAHSRPELRSLSDAEIVLLYNAELRGFATYYARAHGVKRTLDKLAFLWQHSLYKTLATKHRTRVTKIARRLRTPEGPVLTLPEGTGTRTVPLFQLKHLRIPEPIAVAIDRTPNTSWSFHRTEIVRRLLARKCEYCATETGPFVVHHVRKMGDIKGGKEPWQRLMVARSRKTLVLCESCHKLLHAGRLPSPKVTTSNALGESRVR